MKKNSKFKRILIILLIVIINSQQIILAAPAISTIPNNEEYVSRASERILSALIELFQIHLLAVIILFIIILLFLFVSRLSKLIHVKQSLNITNLERINFDKEIKNEISNYSKNALYKLYLVNILTKIIYIISIILLIPITENINSGDLFAILCIVLSFLLPICFIFIPLIKYVKKTEQIIRQVIYSKEPLQNKDCYYAKEAFRNIKRILPLAIIISIFNCILICLFEILSHFA